MVEIKLLPVLGDGQLPYWMEFYFQFWFWPTVYV